LHIGQTDLDPRTARKLLPPGSVLGLSVGSQEEASRLLDLSKDEEGTLVDYVGIGAVWRTTSKDVSKKVMLGPEGVGKILDLLHDGSGGSIKSVAIGECFFATTGLCDIGVLRYGCTVSWYISADLVRSFSFRSRPIIPTSPQPQTQTQTQYHRRHPPPQPPSPTTRLPLSHPPSNARRDRRHIRYSLFPPT
jgi:hypothetical protein